MTAELASVTRCDQSTNGPSLSTFPRRNLFPVLAPSKVPSPHIPKLVRSHSKPHRPTSLLRRRIPLHLLTDFHVHIKEF